MALVTRTYLTDDLDGSEDDVSTVRLALDKVSYEIDLSAVNEARLRDKLAKFVAAGTEVRAKPVAGRGRKSAAVANTGGSQPHENQAPYLVLNFIIALVGIFPSRN